MRASAAGPRRIPNAQAFVLPYDGLNRQPSTYCFLNSHYLNVQASYFDHVMRGACDELQT